MFPLKREISIKPKLDSCIRDDGSLNTKAQSANWLGYGGMVIILAAPRISWVGQVVLPVLLRRFWEAVPSVLVQSE